MNLIGLLREYIFLFLANHLPAIRLFDGSRGFLLRRAGVVLGARSSISGPIVIDYDAWGWRLNVRIGSDCVLASNLRLSCGRKSITIGNNVLVGPDVIFETRAYTLSLDVNGQRTAISRPIRVGDKVWIGAGATILPGVSIGEGAVVAAGAVVTRNVKPWSLVGGVPARELQNGLDRLPGGRSSQVTGRGSAPAIRVIWSADTKRDDDPSTTFSVDALPFA